MNKNECYTYFAIKGDFDPDEISGLLELTPYEQWKIGDQRNNGLQYTFACWKYGRCDQYDVYVDNMMMITIQDLLPKVDVLNHIREMYDVSFFLEVVPTVYPGESSPVLAPDRDVIQFCYETHTSLDIDLYVCDAHEHEHDYTTTTGSITAIK